jgi:hypothetical protein
MSQIQQSNKKIRVSKAMNTIHSSLFNATSNHFSVVTEFGDIEKSDNFGINSRLLRTTNSALSHLTLSDTKRKKLADP